MLVPAEKHAVGHGLNVHMRTTQGDPVIGAVFDDFLVEFLVLAPAGDSKGLGEGMGKFGDIQIAVNTLDCVGVVGAGHKIPANHELKQLNVFL